MPEPTSLADAHAALVRDRSFQFDLPSVDAPRPDTRVFKPLISWSPPPLTPAELWILGGIAAAVVALVAVWMWRRRAPRVKPVSAPAPAAPVLAVPDRAARSALARADALAAEGRFLDAAHEILLCGVKVIAEHHPDLVRPTTTSRDLIGLPAVPEGMRRTFGGIANVVEIGLFGGRPIGAEHWGLCRRIFVDSAFAAAGERVS